MNVVGVLITVGTIICLNIESGGKISEEEIYSKVLTEFLDGIIDGDEGVKKVLIKQDLEKEPFGFELNYGDLGYLSAISKNFLIVEGNEVRPDSVMIEMVKKYQESEIIEEIDFSKIEIPYEIGLISANKFSRKLKRKNGWEKFHKKNPSTFGIIGFSNLVFSEDNRYCAFYLTYMRGGLNGYGGVLVIDLEGENLIKGEIELWAA